MDGLDDEMQHRRGEAGIDAEEDGLVHQPVGADEVADGAEGLRIRFAQFDEGGLPYQVAAEEHAVADLLLVEVPRERRAGEGRAGTHEQHEAEPTAIRAASARVPLQVRRGPARGVRRQRELEELLERRQAFAQILPIALPRLNERGQFLHLAAANRGLDV